jgi:hypothetical protein
VEYCKIQTALSNAGDSSWISCEVLGPNVTPNPYLQQLCCKETLAPNPPPPIAPPSEPPPGAEPVCDRCAKRSLTAGTDAGVHILAAGAHSGGSRGHSGFRLRGPAGLRPPIQLGSGDAHQRQAARDTYPPPSLPLQAQVHGRVPAARHLFRHHPRNHVLPPHHETGRVDVWDAR